MRNEFYLELINEGVNKLLNFQDIRPNSITEGCFFYHYWKSRKINYINSRWQEAVLSLSWFYNKYNSEEIWARILKGIDFWCKLQHKNGSFPEHSRIDRSFAATAFSSLAIINSIILLNYSKERWLEKLNKSCNYLIKNDEIVLINQEMAASLALMKFGNYVNNSFYLKESEKKLNLVLKNQSTKGYYKERNGFELGYSTLTLGLLGHYYLATDDERILNSASKFIDLIANLDFEKIKNLRHSNWVIIDGFEIFADKTVNGKEALRKIIDNFNISNLELDRNLCTELPNLCFAYNNCREDIEHRDLDANIQKTIYPIYKENKLLNLLRPFGIHKFRKIKYMLF